MLLRRPQGEGPFSLKSFGTCPKCFGWVADLAKHANYRCSIREKSDQHTSRGSLKTKSETLVGKHKDASELLRNEVYPKMLSDHMSFMAKNDPIIVELGNLWMKRSVKNKLRWASYTRQKMQSAARLLE